MNQPTAQEPALPALPAPELEAVQQLWAQLAKFPAGEADAAVRYLMEWIAGRIEADNVIWVGAVRILVGDDVGSDPFLGWRLRARYPLREDTAAYRKQLPYYYNTEHYGKLSPTYYERPHDDKEEDHVGMTGRASLAGAGRFRVHRLRDGWIDWAAFRRTGHYRLYYRDGGISDRMTIGFPVNADSESFLLIDRHQKKNAPRHRNFTLAEAALAGHATRGVPELHRRLFLSNGLLVGDKPLSPTERQIILHLLTGSTEKMIAAALGQQPATLHKYITGLYARYGVNSRPSLMALWLGSQ